MTELSKPVRRITSAKYRGNNIVVEIAPPSIIRVKEKGSRIWYEVSVEAIYIMAAKIEAERMYREKTLNRLSRGRSKR